MPDTLAIPETVSLPSGAILEACAELEAVETMLSRLWGHQDGGHGNVAGRIGQAISTLLYEAFGADEYESMVALSAERATRPWRRGFVRSRSEGPTTPSVSCGEAAAMMPDLRVVSSSRKTEADLLSEIATMREEVRSLRQLVEPVLTERVRPELSVVKGGCDNG